MGFELPELEYAYDALEPHIDAETMELHHSKHHAGYTANLNAANNGYGYGGPGGYTESIITIPSGVTSITVIVGKGGQKGTQTGDGYGGGGGSGNDGGNSGGQGGGRSAIIIGSNEVLTAGGGGGGGYVCSIS